MKLLNKSMRMYTLVAAGILIFAVPLLIYAVQRIVSEDVDESLQARQEKILDFLQQHHDAVTRTQPDPDIEIRRSQDSGFAENQFSTQTLYDSISREEIPYRLLCRDFTVNGEQYQLCLRNSLLDSQDLMESIVKIAALILLLIILGMLLINQLLSRKIWKPFYNTISNLRQYKIEEAKTIEPEAVKITEFSDLNKAIGSLSQRNRDVFLMQKEFTENAAHEMQTPLAVLQGKLDLLMQTQPLNEEQSELISSLAAVSQRMKHLNKSLLLLSRIDNNQFAATTPVRADLIIQELVQEFQVPAGQQQIRLENNFHEQLLLQANSDLIRILFGNLLSNAVRYTPVGGQVIIQYAAPELSILNTAGSGPLDATKLFSRFQKQNSRQDSVGLGLAIARQVAVKYGFTIRYQFAEGQHGFVLRFSF